MNTFINLSSSHFVSTSPSSSSPMSPPRASLAPLRNHNYPGSSKPSTGFYPPFPKHQQQQQIPHRSFKNVSTIHDDAPPMPSSATTPILNHNSHDDDERSKFLANFDCVYMRSRSTHVELAKTPHLNENGVRFHSPAMPSVTYDTVFQTTHDFLNLSITLHMYPTFVDLPLHLRPSKAQYRATAKQSEDQTLRVRCLFCRARFGGKNVKALWERHAKEHWPKGAESTRPQQQQIPRISFKNVSTIQDDTSPMLSTSSTALIPPTPIPNYNNDDDVERAIFLAKFDYVYMRSRSTHAELAKTPHLNENGVRFHSPAMPSVTYDTVFQTTHDFLNFSITLHMYPAFIDLPLHLRPSKAHYDPTTKQSEDQMLRVRCLFCRGRFGGKNAKALWERHVKEHWPKQQQGESTSSSSRNHSPKKHDKVLLDCIDRIKEYPKEEIRRPTRQIRERPFGSMPLFDDSP